MDISTWTLEIVENPEPDEWVERALDMLCAYSKIADTYYCYASTGEKQ